jgi:uncharacterized membrane protein YbhN (UPF0104 family)
MPAALAFGTPLALQGAFVAWIAALAGAVVVAFALVVIARRGHSGRIGRMAAGLTALRQGGHLRAAIVMTLALMTFEVLILYCAVRAVGGPASLKPTLFAFLGAQLAFLIPGPPSSVGALEAGIVVTLGATGVDSGRALAAALLYHAVHAAVETPVGLPFLRAAAWRPWRTETPAPAVVPVAEAATADERH